jgi:DNA-binding transcriptional LysR family regulator
MNTMLAGPDWGLWRSFGAVVEAGSLSAAARRLGLSQPTLGRHIEALEGQLGVSLFERTLQGLNPTEVALRLYEPVAAAQQALAEAAMVAEGSTTGMAGVVRITASTVISHYVLPGLLAPIRRDFPQVALEIVASDSAENLMLREADIAVRMFRPAQLDLVTRKLGEVGIVACAHEDYLARRGAPGSLEELRGHDLVGFDRSSLIIDAAKSLGIGLSRDSFIIRTDSQTLLWELLKAGLGIGFAQAPLVAATPGLVRILPGLGVPPLEIWLTTHRELFTSRRIRAIYDRLAEGFGGYLGGRGP